MRKEKRLWKMGGVSSHQGLSSLRSLDGQKRVWGRTISGGSQRRAEGKDIIKGFLFRNGLSSAKKTKAAGKKGLKWAGETRMGGKEYTHQLTR